MTQTTRKTPPKTHSGRVAMSVRSCVCGCWTGRSWTRWFVYVSAMVCHLPALHDARIVRRDQRQPPELVDEHPDPDPPDADRRRDVEPVWESRRDVLEVRRVAVPL